MLCVIKKGTKPKTETATVTPTTSQQVITPSDDKHYLSQVTVNAIQTQTKSATPSRSSQTISADSGKYLTSVTVARAQPASGSRLTYTDWYYDRTSGTLSIGATVGSLIIVRLRSASSGAGFSIASGMTLTYTGASTSGNPDTIYVGYATAATITFNCTGGEYYIVVDQLAYAGG